MGVMTTAQWREAVAGTVGDWAEARVIEDGQEISHSGRLYQDYMAWMEEQRMLGRRASRVVWGKRMGAAYTRIRSSGTYKYVGIRLRQESDPPVVAEIQAPEI